MKLFLSQGKIIKKTLDEVKDAYKSFSKIISLGLPNNLEESEKIRNGIFSDSAFPGLQGKKRPHFDTKNYPSIGTDIPLVNINGVCDCANIILPKSMGPIDISAYITKNPDPFIELLLGLIWKQGDFNQLTMLFKGVRNIPLEPSDRVVMWQFGRHMCSPLSEPIFDQHTFRAFVLLNHINDWAKAHHTLQDLKNVLDANNATTTKLKNLKSAHLAPYLTWWNQYTANVRIIKPDIDCYLLLQEFDRIMFSMGKAAKF